ncbi:amino acid transporter [Xylaria sp. CBS 124048]|nr:amino acid transporter [Xylaria sp. CBS 124048]
MDTEALQDKSGYLHPHVSSSARGPISADDATLTRLGKKPVLTRRFGFMTSLGFSCTVLITWEGALFVFLSGLQNGGPSGIIYGYILVWAGMLSLMITLSELVSMAPTSGGQYHWSAMLAPPSAQKITGYITGWLALSGWQATLASSGLLTGTMIQNLVLLTHPEYLANKQNWHGTLILWGVLILMYGLNTAFSTLFAKFEGFAFLLHILGFFAILLPLVFLGDHASPRDVFDNYMNLGGWQTQGLSFCIGLLGNVFAFVGGDAAVHLSEEVHNAAVAIPWSLIITLLINGSLGFAILIATLFCMGDLDSAVAENAQYPYMVIFRNAVDSVAGATVMSSIIVVMIFVAATGCLASTSRVYWALARDRAVPGWTFLKRTSTRTGIPRNAVLTASIISAVLSLVNIGDATAFNGVISISVAGLFGSYLVVAALLLYRRVTGGILEPTCEDDTVRTNTIGTKLTWGPWRLKGILGIANNTFTCGYLIFILFFSFWPTYREVTPQNMNWAVLVTVVVVFFNIIYYLVWARKTYRGPIVET